MERGSVGLMERELILNEAVVIWGIDVVGVGNGARGGGLIESILGTTKGGRERRGEVSVSPWDGLWGVCARAG